MNLDNSIRLVFALALFTAKTYVHGQDQVNSVTTIDAGKAFTEIGSLPKHIREASGLATTDNKTFWTHNDGGAPILFNVDTAGHVVKTLQLNHPNSGWEDLATDKKGNLYVGAFGNNNNEKRSLKIYKVRRPDLIKDRVHTADIIQYQYADQHSFPPPVSKRNFDMDAFIALGDSLYLFSKNRTEPFTGYTKVYRLSQTPGEQIAVPVDSIFLGSGPMMDNWVTGATISPDEKTIVLLSHACVWIITGFKEGKFSDGKIHRLNLNHLSHKAGVSFSGSTKLIIVDELEFGLLGGKVYALNLKDILDRL